MSSANPPKLGSGTMDWVMDKGWKAVRTVASAFVNLDWPDAAYECKESNIYGVLITEAAVSLCAIRDITLTEDTIIKRLNGGFLLGYFSITAGHMPF